MFDAILYEVVLTVIVAAQSPQEVQMPGTAFGRRRARNAKPKTRFLVTGTLEFPRVTFEGEKTEAYSGEQAIRFVLIRLARKYGLVKVFSPDARAEKL
jgi:hypothetical protein